MNSFQDLLIRCSSPYEYCPQERNVINFFICSAFEDFEVERKILSNRIFTKLRTKCFDEFGIEIKLIDVKLGIDSTLEATKTYYDVYHEYLKKNGICDKYNCPIFLMGQKYGRPLIPFKLPMDVFELFQETLRRHKKKFPVDPNFLNDFYIKDANSVHLDFVLVDNQELLPDLYSDNKTLISESRKKLKQIHALLSELFEKLLDICLTNGSLDISTARNIFIHEFDNSISETLRKSINSEFNPIIFSREIIDIKNFIELSNINNNDKQKLTIEKLIDVYYKEENQIMINEDSQILLKQCYDCCFEIYGTNDQPFKILWRDDTGICEPHHKSYIDKFVQYFTDKILEAVALRSDVLNVELPPSLLKCYDMICEVNLQANTYSKEACGFENICSALLDYIIDDTGNIPLILYGPANSGKALILSRTIKEIQDSQQSFADYHIITRFINSNYTINEVVLSIFIQMSAIVLKENQFETIMKNCKEIENTIPKDIEGVMYSFQQHSGKKFIFVLHDLEKCLDINTESDFDKIIPKLLPENMKLIVTSTENWESRNPLFLNICVPEFTQTEFNIFVQTQLSHCGKFLTEEQNEKLLPNYLRITKNILTAKILVNYLTEYHLSKNQEYLEYPRDINQFYSTLLNEWYLRFGQKLISHILLFIYYSHDGLRDQEIVDILNLDEQVIKELNVLHDEVIIVDEDVLRFSMGFWLMIKQALSVIFIERMQDGYIVIDLASVTVIESLIKSQDENQLQYFHRLLAEYYLGSWSERKKNVFVESSQSNELYYCYPRDQKMFSKSKTNTFYNYRKFRQIVRHLIYGEMKDLLKEVIFNFDWLYYKTKAMKVTELLKDFQLSENDGKEILLLEESFRNSALTIENDLDSLAGELIGQLLPYVPYYPNLRFLIENCDKIAPKHNAFIPIYPTNKLPGSPLVSTINCPGSIESMIVMQNDNNNNNELLIKLKNDSRAYFYDLSAGEISYFTLFSNGKVYIGPQSNVILILETEYKQIIKVHERISGELLGQIIPMNWVVLRPFEERNKYKITNIDVGKTKVALIITNEISYLFIVNLETLEPILAFNPGIRLQMLKLTSDESTVYTHHFERLVSLDVEKNQLNSAVELQGVPFQMLFSKENFRKAFIVCENQKSVVVLDLESSGAVAKCYKISFENCLDEGDYVLEVSTSDFGNPYLLIKSCHSLILYEWIKEKVLSHITRPSQLPIYFKLPNQHDNQPASLQFNAAKLILSDRVIICALFRDIIVCTVHDNRVIKTLHAPVGGIVSEILLADQYIIGKVEQNQDSSEVMIWKTDPSCLFSKIETNQDKLTKSINNLHIGDTVAIATCENSDEMGVIEISTGTLVDLYSHSSAVINSSLSSCGKWAFVTIDNAHNANILWSLEARKIVFEFGNSTNTAYILSMQSASGFYCITNHSTSIELPNFIVTQILCDSKLDKSHSMKILQIENLGFICETPCFLNNDTILVNLSNKFDIQDGIVENQKVLNIWVRENYSKQVGVSDTVILDHLSTQINKPIETFLSVKPSSKDDNILLLYKLKSQHIDILMYNCKSKLVIKFIELFDIFSDNLDTKDIFVSHNGNYLFHQKTCSIVDLFYGSLVGHVLTDSNVEYQFRCFALRNTILVLSYKAKLVAWRLPEISKIGQIELKEEITYVSKCTDDFTLMIGCMDGSVLSYALIDIFSPHSSLCEIKIVRNFQPQSRSPTIQLELTNPISSTKLSQEFEGLINIKRPISEPIVAYERREFSNIL